MEPYIKNNVNDITYKSELIPTSALKFSLKILVYLTSRDTIDNLYPSRNPRGVALSKPFKEGAKHPKNLCDIFGIRFGINSHINLRRAFSTYVSLRG